MENPVSMSSGDSLQDWSSDSISSHQTQVRSQAVQKLQLQLAQAPIALSLHYLFNYIILFFFPTWYVIKRSTAYQVEKNREMITSFYSQVLQFEQAAGQRVTK